MRFYFNYKNIALIFALTFLSFASQAQYYILGQDPAGIKWRQINTQHFRLVYPSDFEPQAQRMMNILDKVYDADSKTMEFKACKMPFIFHNRDVTPNAFTVWTPKRIELYTCPSQITYAQDWMEQLAIHEYRHAIQTDCMNKGFTKFLSYLLGEQAPAAVLGLYIPLWFMEGDAVSTETAVSHSGRGRVPNFEQDIRAQLLEKGSFNYDKAVFGSFKDFVPDQYSLGYHFVANVRKNYGYEAWVKALDRVAHRPFGITPFSTGLKLATGKTKVGLFKETMAQLSAEWKEQSAKTQLTQANQISPTHAILTNYKYPHYLSDSLVIAERSGMDDISRFVTFDKQGKEKILFTPGFYSTDAFSIQVGTGFKDYQNKPGTFTADNITISKGLLAWTEKEVDPRWQNRTYSVIKLYDFQTGKARHLTKKTRIFVPSLSPDGKKIAAINISLDNENSLVLINVQNGQITDTLLSAKNEQLLTPSWSNDGGKIVFMKLDPSGKSIEMMDIKGKVVKTLVSPTFTEISNPVFAKEYVLFNGSWSGIENVWAVNTKDNSLWQVTSSAFGACNADYNYKTGNIVYSDYNSSGYRVVEAAFNLGNLTPIASVDDNSVKLYTNLVREELSIVDSATIGNKAYESKKYSKIGHSFRFHSWAPFSLDLNNETLNNGLTLMSQNDLSTLAVQLGYDWDYNDQTGRARAAMDIYAWYPVINISGYTGQRAGYHVNNDQSTTRYTYNENQLNTGISLPLLFSRGKYYNSVEPSITDEIITDFSNSDSPLKINGGTSNILEYRLQASNYLKQATRDVYPKWGQSLDINFRNAPFAGTYDMGYVFGASSYLFFPGLSKNDGIKIYAGYQQRPSDYNYDVMVQQVPILSNIIVMPRGFKSAEEVHSLYQQQKLFIVNFNYKFPFWYPDVAIGPLAYFKRFKANLFYDYATSLSGTSSEHYQSTGVELSSDMNIMRFLFPFDMGVRAGYKPDSQKFFFDFLLSINIGI